MASLRKAVDMMCKTCIYDPLVPGTWRTTGGGVHGLWVSLASSSPPYLSEPSGKNRQARKAMD